MDSFQLHELFFITPLSFEPDELVAEYFAQTRGRSVVGRGQRERGPRRGPPGQLMFAFRCAPSDAAGLRKSEAAPTMAGNRLNAGKLKRLLEDLCFGFVV